ncbi:MAG: alanine racemase [Eubacteriales bacterium]|nr:alanine racemase [Eubacteriales bacterium]
MTEEIMKKTGEISAEKTPCYVFDLDVLNSRMELLGNVKASNSKICYAMKANPFLIEPMEAAVDYFEVCSPGELEICKEARIAPEKIVFSGVNKRKEEIAEAIRYGVGIVTLESLAQFQYVKECAGEFHRIVSIMPRLTGGGQFGMEKSELEQIIVESRNSPMLEVAGIHYFTGTQKKKSEKILEEARYLQEYCDDLQKRLGFIAPTLEFGTGMAVPYFEGDNFEDDLDAFIKLADFISSDGKKYQWTLEFGRYLTASCGYYFSSVVDTKKNHGIHYAIMDGGIHHINYFGQNMAMRVPKIIHLKKNEENRAGKVQEWCVCGSLCTFADVLVRKLAFSDLEQGDVLVFQNAGAYSVTEAIYLLLSRKMPGIYFYSEKSGLCMARDQVETWRLNKKTEIRR